MTVLAHLTAARLRDEGHDARAGSGHERNAPRGEDRQGRQRAHLAHAGGQGGAGRHRRGDREAGLTASGSSELPSPAGPRPAGLPRVWRNGRGRPI